MLEIHCVETDFRRKKMSDLFSALSDFQCQGADGDINLPDVTQSEFSQMMIIRN